MKTPPNLLSWMFKAVSPGCCVVFPVRPQCWNIPSRTHRRAMTTKYRCTTSRSKPSGKRLRRPSGPWRGSHVSAATWQCTRHLWRTSWRGTRGSSRTRTTGNLQPHRNTQKHSDQTCFGYVQLIMSCITVFCFYEASNMFFYGLKFILAPCSFIKSSLMSLMSYLNDSSSRSRVYSAY